MEDAEEGKPKQKRGNKGDGSIRSISRGKWRVTVDFGRNPVTKKRERVTRVVNGTKADARKVRDQIRQERDFGLKAEGRTTTFSELIDMWDRARRITGGVSESTMKQDRSRMRYVEECFGDSPINDIDARMVEGAYASIRDAHHLGGTSMHRIHTVLKNVFGKAVDYDLILRNPCDRAAAPKRNDPERGSLSVEEARRLLGCLDEAEAEAYQDMDAKESRQTERGNLFGRCELRGLGNLSCLVAVRLAIETGMRRGEAFGLCWGSVVLNQRCAKVLHSLTVEGIIKEPKTKAGLRTVGFSTDAELHLERWKKRQAIELLKLGIKQDDATPVCCSDAGRWYDLPNFERWWRGFRDRYGFKDLKFHELRHTQATQLLASGIDVKTVQERLGHSNASITLNWYVHAIPENDRKAADLIGELFAREPEDPHIIEFKTA